MRGQGSGEGSGGSGAYVLLFVCHTWDQACLDPGPGLPGHQGFRDGGSRFFSIMGQGSGARGQGLARVQGFRVQSPQFEAQIFRVQIPQFRVQGPGFRAQLLPMPQQGPIAGGSLCRPRLFREGKAGCMPSACALHPGPCTRPAPGALHAPCMRPAPGALHAPCTQSPACPLHAPCTRGPACPLHATCTQSPAPGALHAPYRDELPGVQQALPPLVRTVRHLQPVSRQVSWAQGPLDHLQHSMHGGWAGGRGTTDL